MKWLLLRGLGRQIKHWYDFAPMLNDNSEGIIAIDLPGVATQSDSKTPLTIGGHTEFLRNIFQNQRFPNQKYGLLGISLGGMIALDWVARYPNDFSMVVAINTSSRDSGHLLQRLSPFALYQTARVMAQKNSIDRERQIMKLVTNIRTQNDEIIEDFSNLREKEEVGPEIIAKQLLAASQFMLPSKIQTPLLLLASNKDHMVDPRCSRQIAANLNATLKMHPRAGHDLTLDDPEWCVKQILDFQNNLGTQL